MRIASSFGIMALAVLFCATGADASLIISEIMYKPSGTNNSSTTGDEWFEIFNAGPGSVNLANYNYDDDTDASTSAGGVRLTSSATNLSAGQYAIIAQESLANWEAEFGTLAAGTVFLQVSSWQALADGGEPLTLYDRVNGTNFFSVDYTHPQRNGVSVMYSGTNPALAQPFSFTAGHWIDAPSAGGGSSGDKHTAGSGTMQANTAPEPASMALVGIASAGITLVVRRQRRNKNSELAASSAS